MNPAAAVDGLNYLLEPGGGSGRVGDPALTSVLTFKLRAVVWLCCSDQPPALTFVLTFICPYSFWILTFKK